MSTALIKPEWSPLTIILMVLGFILFWPLGLAMLAYILWGEKFGGSREKAERFMNRQKDWFDRQRRSYRGYGAGPTSGNAAFDDYREQQLKRLDEERRRLDDEVREFHDYMDNLKKARDREEFDRFMRERRARNAGETGGGTYPGEADVHRQGY